MSKVKATMDGFVGHNGVPVQLHSGDVYDAEHPLALARPDLFEEVLEAPKRPILTRGPKGKPSDD